MSAAGPSAITDAVLDSFAATPEPRLKAIVTALVRHGHAFVGEVRPTQAEWAAAVAFLKRAGDISQGARQEFILLSDVLGVSMLVDALGHDGDVAATDSTVLGPFYVEGAPVLAAGADIAAGSEGAPLWIDIVVADVDGAPVTGAVVDIWQTDGDGLYDVQRDLPADAHATRGRFRSNEAGRVCCWSVVPISYQIPSDGPVGDLLAATGRHPWRPAHVHFRIAADGWRPLVTHLFVSGDAYLDSDAVFGVKPSLIVDLPAQDRPAPPGRVVDGGWRRLDYRFVLQREGR